VLSVPTPPELLAASKVFVEKLAKSASKKWSFVGP
jgi:hypothetical protein